MSYTLRQLKKVWYNLPWVKNTPSKAKRFKNRKKRKNNLSTN